MVKDIFKIFVFCNREWRKIFSKYLYFVTVSGEIYFHFQGTMVPFAAAVEAVVVECAVVRSRIKAEYTAGFSLPLKRAIPIMPLNFNALITKKPFSVTASATTSPVL